MVERGFLDAICREPEEDAPRLVYADWLEEQGNPLGEFIRVQCERARLDDRDPRCIDLEYQARSLLAKHRNRWAKPFRKWARNETFERGFVNNITIPTKDFLEQGKTILDQAPVQNVKLTHPKNFVEQLAKSQFLKRISGLNLRDGKLGLARLKTLLTSPHLGHLQHLDLSYNGLAYSALEVLCTCNPLAQLRSLSLDKCKIGPNGLELLLSSGLIDGMRELQLNSNGIDDEGAGVIARCPNLRHLRRLSLEFNDEFSAAGIQSLLTSPHLTGLERLSLRECQLHAPEMRAFVAASNELNLLALELENNWFENTGIARLAESSCLSGLVELSMGWTRMEHAGLRSLLESGNLRHLRTLNLNRNGLSHVSVKMLCEWEGARLLTDLNLSANDIGDRGAATLAKAENLSNLNVLNLQGTGMTEKGIHALAESSVLNRLTTLCITAKSWNAPELNRDSLQTLVKRFGRHVCRFD